jgi:S1-C subfamily serine protease
LWVALAAAGAGALATLALLAAFGVFDSDTPSAPTTRRAERVKVEDEAVAKLAADIAPSIVTVAVLGPGGARRGSGVCVRHGGDILTSNRLVRGASRVTVVTHDGRPLTAQVRGGDADTDLALLHVGASIQAAPVAQRPVSAGDTVLAVGASGAKDTPPWIGDGIVASVDGLVAQLGGPAMDGLIATDASSGKVGAGGALLDRQGTVAGIVLAPIDGDSVTYAVPIGVAAQVAMQLAGDGKVAHGWMGVQGSDASGVPTVTGLTAAGPAAHAGMRVGDVIVAIADKPVMTMGEVVATVRWFEPKRVVQVKVRRGRVPVNLEVRLGDAPTDDAAAGA